MKSLVLTAHESHLNDSQSDGTCQIKRHLSRNTRQKHRPRFVVSDLSICGRSETTLLPQFSQEISTLLAVLSFQILHLFHPTDHLTKQNHVFRNCDDASPVPQHAASN